MMMQFGMKTHLERDPEKREAMKALINNTEAEPLLKMALASIMSAQEFDKRIHSQSEQVHCDETTYDMLGYSRHPGDPERYDWNTVDRKLAEIEKTTQKKLSRNTFLLNNPDQIKSCKRNRYDPQVENGMVSFIRTFPDDAVAQYGYAHLPYIVDGILADNHQTLLAYAINDQRRGLLFGLEDETQKRYDRIDRLIANGHVQNPPLKYSPINCETALRMALQAAFRHRAAVGEISEETATMLEAAMEYAPRYGILEDETKDPLKSRGR